MEKSGQDEQVWVWTTVVLCLSDVCNWWLAENENDVEGEHGQSELYMIGEKKVRLNWILMTKSSC